MALRVCASVEGLQATDTLTIQCDLSAHSFASQLPPASAGPVAGEVLADAEGWLVEPLETGQLQPHLSLLSRAKFDTLNNTYLLPPAANGSLLCTVAYYATENHHPLPLTQPPPRGL